MKIKRWIQRGIIVLTVMPALYGQLPEFNYKRAFDVPFFYYDVVTHAAADQNMTVLNLYTKVAYDELQFLKVKDGFQAEYEFSVTIFNQQGGQADGIILKKQVVVNSFDETNIQTVFDVSEAEFVIKPGKYELLISIMDMDSKKTGRQKSELLIPGYQGPGLQISDIIIADSVVVDSIGNIQAVANVIGNFGESQESLYFVYDLYHTQKGVEIPVQANILDIKGKVLKKIKKTLVPDELRLTDYFRMDRKDLEIGKYNFQLIIGSDEQTLEKMKNFTVRWIGMPSMIQDLDAAIEQLRYIAKGSAVKEMKKAEEKERLRLFMEFWEERDPTPGTESNELMQEYYRRVEFANVKFSTYLEGWRSDRGMVYILLGPPNDIERHPFEVDSRPYEIWSYYQINREYIFVDNTGFGDYRLATPYYDVIENVH